MGSVHATSSEFYSSLNAETRVVVQQKTGEIRDRMKKAAADIVAIGERLIVVKETLGHGKFGKWLDCEFGWSDSAAQKMMSVSRQFKSVKFTDLSIAPSALYLLASDSTPAEVREEVIVEARAGKPITHAEVKARVEQAKPLTPEQVKDNHAFLERMGMGIPDPDDKPARKSREPDPYEGGVVTTLERTNVKHTDAPSVGPMVALISKANRAMDRLRDVLDEDSPYLPDLRATYKEARTAVSRLIAEIE